MKMKTILYLLLLTTPTLIFSQTRIESKQWYTDSGHKDFQENRHYDSNGELVMSITLNNEYIVLASLYKSIGNKDFMYDLDGRISAITENNDNETIITYYDHDGNPDFKTVSTDISENSYRFINYDLPDYRIREVFERTNFNDGTALIKYLDFNTFEVLREEEITKWYDSDYTYERYYDSEGKLIQEIAFRKRIMVYDKIIRYIE